LVGFCWALVWISVVWAVLNLVPVLPLDGGQMLHAVLGPERVKITLWVSILCAVTLGAAAWIFLKMLIFPILLGFFAYQSWQRLQGLR
jgi:membrane-associated protease RseP (regulator of RpoE activity)